MNSRLLLALGFLTAACSGSEQPSSSAGDLGGTIVVAAPAEPEHLVPPIVSTLAGKQVFDQVFEPLAAAGPSLNTLGDKDFEPKVAKQWSWSSDSSSVTFAIDPEAQFHDGKPVTAEDVKFSFLLYHDPAVGSPHVASFPRIDSVVVNGPSSVTFHFGDRSPERFYKLATNVFVMPRHLLESADRAKLAESPFAQHPVGSGPFRFGQWERGSTLSLVADTTGRRRARVDRLVWRFVADFNAAARAVVAGEADVVETLRPEGIALVTPEAPAAIVEYPASDHGYLLFNTRSTTNRRQPHPILGDAGVRRALAMAINRPALVKNALDSLARVGFGPFQRWNWAADTTIRQPRFDLAASHALLDSLGWRDANGDGVRERGAQALRFKLLVPSVSATRRQMAVLLQEQLKQAGAQVEIEALDPPAMLPQLVSGKFEAFIHVWRTDATPSGIAQAWGGQDLERSANFGWYASATVDSLIALAVAEQNLDRARGLYRSIYQTIVDDAPAVFLWEPRSFSLVNKRIRTGTLHTDWWSTMARWSIPAAQRIDRDNVK
jgi:peptide/nickel transport system substrate-binding protein